MAAKSNNFVSRMSRFIRNIVIGNRYRFNLTSVSLDSVEGWISHGRTKPNVLIELRTTNQEVVASTEVSTSDYPPFSEVYFEMHIDVSVMRHFTPGRFLFYVDSKKVAQTFFFSPLGAGVSVAGLQRALDDREKAIKSLVFSQNEIEK